MKEEEMDPAEQHPAQEQKLKDLEQQLNDLRQGLTTVVDYCHDLEAAARKQEATTTVDQDILIPLADEDLEFEGIWRFHEEVLLADPDARVSFAKMYEAFVTYCTKTGRTPVDKDAFDFVFSQMKDPAPGCERGEWTGYRLRSV